MPGKGVDAVNFRSLKESESVDISRTRSPGNGIGNGDVGERTDNVVDPFGEFNSGISLTLLVVRWIVTDWGGVVTLHYDGDDYHADEHLLIRDTHRTAFAEA